MAAELAARAGPAVGPAVGRAGGGTTSSEAAAPAPAARAWLWSTVALSFGAIVTAIALAPPATAPARTALAYLLFAGSSAHVASTAWFYTVPQVRGHMRRHRARYAWTPLALIAGAGAIAVALPPTVLNWLLVPYFGWQFFHYQKQNLGVAALAAAVIDAGLWRLRDKFPRLFLQSRVPYLVRSPRLPRATPDTDPSAADI